MYYRGNLCILEQLLGLLSVVTSEDVDLPCWTDQWHVRTYIYTVPCRERLPTVWETDARLRKFAVGLTQLFTYDTTLKYVVCKRKARWTAVETPVIRISAMLEAARAFQVIALLFMVCTFDVTDSDGMFLQTEKVTASAVTFARQCHVPRHVVFIVSKQHW